MLYSFYFQISIFTAITEPWPKKHAQINKGYRDRYNEYKKKHFSVVAQINSYQGFRDK